MAKRSPDRVTAYAQAVEVGKEIAGPWVRLACARHMRDLREAKDRGLVWSVAKADAAIAFFERVLVLPDVDADGVVGEGSPFLLQAWQVFVIGSLYGWLGDDGERRFRVAYVETGKGSGKSPMAAGLGLYALAVDGGRGAQVFAAATSEHQAKITYRDAENMREASPELRALIKKTTNNLSIASTASFFRPVSAEKRGLDGKRVQLALIDELHEHPTGLVVDKMRAGTKGRPNALVFEITNSGYDRTTVCWQHHEYSLKVLQGVVENDSWFAYVCALDEGDRWDVEGPHWRKANPNLGVSIPLTYLREQVREAKGMPSKENIVRRLNFCEWTEQHTRWIPLTAWDACQPMPPLEELEDRRCFVGLDLASKSDIVAAVAVFPLDDGTYAVLPRFWVPEETAVKRTTEDHVRYADWIASGHLQQTDGNVTDQRQVRADLDEWRTRYRPVELDFDPWEAAQITRDLSEDGWTVVEIRQNFGGLNEGSKAFESLANGGKIRHGGHPVLRWMVSNVMARQNPEGQIRPDRQRSTEKIDGVVAIIMALSRAIVVPTDAGTYQGTGEVLWVDL